MGVAEGGISYDEGPPKSEAIICANAVSISLDERTPGDGPSGIEGKCGGTRGSTAEFMLQYCARGSTMYGNSIGLTSEMKPGKSTSSSAGSCVRWLLF